MTKLSTFLLCFSLLVCLLVGSSIAGPSAFDDMEFTELERRQDNNSTSVTSESSSSTSTTSRTSTVPTTSRTSTSSRTTPTTSTSATSATSPPTVPETPTTTSSTTTPPPQTSPTQDPLTQTPTDGPVETITPTPTTRVVIATHYTTVTSNGAAFTSAYTTSSTTIETPTGTAGQTPGGSDSGGITPATRNTIIGVVVGVGGALLFGGLAIVAWRLKRKNKNPVDEDDLMRRDGSPLAAGREMHAAGPEQSPFKATLDQYHKPPGVVNASSNF